MKGRRIVVRAETLGYCMGVRRAVDMVYSALDGDTPKPIHTFGPIIHNKPVIRDLEEKGLSVIHNPRESSGTVIIRAHGVGPGVREELEKNAVVIDATCSRVLSSQKKVASFSDKGYTVIIVGDRQHGEVIGLEGYGKKTVVVESEKEAEKVPLGSRNVIIAQTTWERDLYRKICGIIEKRDPGVKIIDSICPATESRQNAMRNLKDQVEALLIVGGKNSANTKSLFHAAVTMFENVWHIEDHEEIPEEVFRFQRIGLSAGASTPDWVIDRVEEELINRE